MPKRLVDSELLQDEWFLNLSKDGKLFLFYLLLNCNHAGIVRLNKKMCKFQTGIQNVETVMKEFGNRLATVTDDILFLPLFIKMQYPDFPKINTKQQASAVNILNEYKLLDKGSLTVRKGLHNRYCKDVKPPVDLFKEEEKQQKQMHPLQRFVDEKNLTNVKQLKNQLTCEQCEKLYGIFRQSAIKKTLLDMENWAKLKTKTSVYLTLVTWMRKDKQNYLHSNE